MSEPRGWSSDEVADVMGGALPVDPEQRRAYALIALRVLGALDRKRTREAFFLGIAPDDLLDEWRAMARDNARTLTGSIARGHATTTARRATPHGAASPDPHSPSRSHHARPDA